MATPVVQEKVQKKALGRGLGALIPGAPVERTIGAGRPQVLQIPIEDLDRDEKQPRQHFDAHHLEELAASIRTKGIVQPILVRKDGGRYRIIAGERRWRAAQLAGLREIPAIVREASAKEAFEIALIETLQREDLNPIEEAEGYKRLIEEHGLTQELVAQRVGKDRSSVANALRLLHLPREIKAALMGGELNMGHARALLGLAEAEAMKRAAGEVVGKKLSVRATEQLVRKLKAGKAAHHSKKREESAQVRSLVDQIQRTLGTKARIIDRGGKGRVELDFYSYDDLDRILARLLPDRR
ncbi:MAG: ParB/RepB/Spo0J family partition protein [Deltaproteobacteria bacterium]|nr:ParB/RepB/Spo0J family partition protein [Deltaproteobacteria bacterium]